MVFPNILSFTRHNGHKRLAYLSESDKSKMKLVQFRAEVAVALMCPAPESSLKRRVGRPRESESSIAEKKRTVQ